MTKKEIIAIVRQMDHSPDFRSYYQFAHGYLPHMRVSGVTDPARFWEVIRHCGETAWSKNTKRAMGILGKGDTEAIQRWCDYLLGMAVLTSAALDDLCSIFGYCAHLGR